MTPTRIRLLPVWFAIAGGLVYLLVDNYHSLLPALSVGGPIGLGVVALGEAVVARGTRARLEGRPRTKPIEPITVARLAALGKATALVAAPLAGAYAGLLGRVLQLDSAVARSDTRIGIAGVVCGVGMCAAGLFLERVCRVKQPPPSDET